MKCTTLFALLFAATLLFVATPSVRAVSAPVNSAVTSTSTSSTAAVMYASGYTDGAAEAQARIEDAQAHELAGEPFARLPFRLMASIARGVAEMFAQVGATVGVAYMLGRADAFDVAADLAGELP